MLSRTCLALILFVIAATTSNADPFFVLSGMREGPNEIVWEIGVQPDLAITPVGSEGEFSLEIGIEFNTDLLSAALDNTWTIDTIEPGHNPFDLKLSDGLVVDMVDDTLFLAASASTEVFCCGLLTIPVATIRSTSEFDSSIIGHGQATYGDYTILPGTADEFSGGRIAQDGQVFDGISGISITRALGDANVDGRVNNDDIVDYVTARINLGNWLELHPGEVPELYLDFDQDGFMNNDDLPHFVTALLNPPFLVLADTTVPEPESVVLMCLVSAAVFCFTQRRRRAC